MVKEKEDFHHQSGFNLSEIKFQDKGFHQDPEQ